MNFAISNLKFAGGNLEERDCQELGQTLLT